MESFVGEPINTRSGQIFINPGTGPVDGATEEHARANMTRLVKDAGLSGARIRRKRKLDDRGRFGYRVTCAGISTDVEMPGLPLERVRFTGEAGQNAWDYPRLYVDGSSWLWKFAIDFVCRKPDEEE